MEGSFDKFKETLQEKATGFNWNILETTIAT